MFESSVVVVGVFTLQLWLSTRNLRSSTADKVVKWSSCSELAENPSKFEKKPPEQW